MHISYWMNLVCFLACSKLRHPRFKSQLPKEVLHRLIMRIWLFLRLLFSGSLVVSFQLRKFLKQSLLATVPSRYYAAHKICLNFFCMHCKIFGIDINYALFVFNCLKHAK